MSFYDDFVSQWIILWILKLQCECIDLNVVIDARIKGKNDEAAPSALVVIGEMLLDNVKWSHVLQEHRNLRKLAEFLVHAPWQCWHSLNNNFFAAVDV